MRTRTLHFALVLLTLSCMLSSCQVAYSNFVGRAYDGASGDRLTTYTVFAEFWRTSIEGVVDENGRYTIGRVPEGQDFTVLVQADGYRSFMAHNAMFDSDIEDRSWNRTESYYYDAYLYPLGLPSPAVTFDINLALTDAKATGLIRLEPSAAPTLSNTDTEPVGVADGDRGRQLWINDDDLQFRSVTRAFSEGEVTFAEGELVYGVNYDVTIFDVDGYENSTQSYTAGTEGHQSWTLNPAGFSDLELVFVSTELGLVSEDGTATLVFNQPITFFGEDRIEFYEEELDDATSIDSPDVDGDLDEDEASGCEEVDDEAVTGHDEDGNPVGSNPFTCPDGDTNILANDKNPEDDEPDDQENGTSMSIEGNRLTISWSDSGLGDDDSGDPIRSITYGGLGSIDLVSARGPITNRGSVGELLGGVGTLTVEMVP